jgi:hypothetical protein
MYFISFSGVVSTENNCQPGEVYFLSLEDYGNYISNPIRVVSVVTRYNSKGAYYVVNQILD